LIGGGPLDVEFHKKLLAHDDATFRAWGVRVAGNQGKVAEAIRDKVAALAKDKSPDVKLQVAIAARKVAGLEPVALLVEVLAGCGDDKLIPGIVWQNLHPLLEDKAATFISVLKKRDTTPNLGLVAARSAERILASKKAKVDVLVDLFALV